MKVTTGYVECPLRVENKSGVPNDSVKAARLQRFLDWRWKNDGGFRREVITALENGWQDVIKRILNGGARAVDAGWRGDA